MVIGCTYYFCYHIFLVFSKITFDENDIHEWCPKTARIPLLGEVIMMYDFGKLTFKTEDVRYSHVVQSLNQTYYVLFVYPPTNKGEVYFEYSMLRHRTNKSTYNEHISHKLCVLNNRWSVFLPSSKSLYYVSYGFAMCIILIVVIYFLLLMIAMCSEREKKKKSEKQRRRGHEEEEDDKGEKEVTYEPIPLGII